MPKSDDTPEPLFYEIATVSFAAILLEIAYTRIFSFKIFYFFTYVVIAIALSGLGAGGVLVAVSRRLREADLRGLIPPLCFGGGASVLVGYVAVAPMRLDVSHVSADGFEVVKLAVACVIVLVPLLLIGIVIARVLGSRPERASALYAADLGAAALGCAVAVPLLYRLDPPRTIVLAGLVLCAGGLRMARWRGQLAWVGLAVCGVLAAVTATGAGLTDPVTDRYKTYEDFRKAKLVRYTKWNPIFRIDAVDLPFYPGGALMVFHDGLPGSGLRRFRGDLRELDHMKKDPRALAFQVLPPRPTVLIIGSAGGHEVLASLFFGASHITGVELNPATLSMLTDRFADFTGRLAERPDVTFVNADARSFLRQDKSEYDMIWFVAPDSYAATNAASAGAFVLSESYLYTVEMLRECLRHLTPTGIINAQFGEIDYAKKPNRTTRFLTTARAAFEEHGLESFRDHALLAGGPGFPPQQDSVILLSKSALTGEQVQRFTSYVPSVEGGVVLYAPRQPSAPSAPSLAITLPRAELEARLVAYPWQVGPVRDDSPFFWHFASFRRAFEIDFGLEGRLVDVEDAIGEKVMLNLLALVLLLAAVALLAPFWAIRSTWSALPKKAPVAVYFAALGLGFMFVEVTLIQRFTLVLGHPTYSLAVTLAGLLVSAGLGSLASGRFTRRPRAPLVLFALVAALGAAQLFLVPRIADVAAAAPLGARIVLTLALVAPLGLCMGAFLPMGLVRVAALSEHPREYVAWAWAVNAFFSVAASVLSTVLAMTYGFRAVLALAIALYAVAVLALRRFGSAGSREAEG